MELPAPLYAFRIKEEDYSLQAISQGLINDSYKVLLQGKPLYLIQRINTRVFPEVGKLMHNLELGLSLLKDPAYVAIELIPSVQGASYFYTDTGEYWRLYSYVEDSIAYNTISEESFAFEAGRILGLFHSLLQKAGSTDFQISMPGFHNLQRREAEFIKALENALPQQRETAEKAIQFVLQHLPWLHAGQTQLPLRICHNDTKLNNFLFSASTGKALCLADLDTLMPGYFHYDFGDAIRTIVNPAPEDALSEVGISFNRTLFTAFVRGLHAQGHFLETEERLALGYGVVLMPFLHGLRALTDYLQGNPYYKVQYPTQNLDRCRNLFRFTELAMAEQQFMEDQVRSI